jgi:hypothetical protein
VAQEDRLKQDQQRWWVALAALHLGGGALVGALSLSGEGGAGPYLSEVAAAALSWERLAQYTAQVLVYAAAVEVALRGALQPWLARRWGAAASVWICGALYGAVHARYGWASALYGLSLGCWVGWWRARGAPLWVFPVWHMQWDLLAIAGALGWALWSPGPAREAVQRAHKAEMVEQGRLQHHPRHGWLDAAHYHGALQRICALQGRLGDGEVTLRAPFARADGALVWVEHRATIRQGFLTEEVVPVAAGIVLEAARLEEEAQARSPWWSGLALSAWSFEDLPSAQAAALEAALSPSLEARCEGLPRGAAALSAPIPGVSPPEEARRRWRAEGAAQVGRAVRGWAQEGRSPEERGAWDRIQAARRWWSVSAPSGRPPPADPLRPTLPGRPPPADPLRPTLPGRPPPPLRRGGRRHPSGWLL